MKIKVADPPPRFLPVKIKLTIESPEELIALTAHVGSGAGRLRANSCLPYPEMKPEGVSNLYWVLKAALVDRGLVKE